jgi:hypothetical protein
MSIVYLHINQDVKARDKQQSKPAPQTISKAKPTGPRDYKEAGIAPLD